MTLAVPPSPEGRGGFREEPFHLTSLSSNDPSSLIKAISALTAGYRGNREFSPARAVEILASRVEEIRGISSFNYAQTLGFFAQFGVDHELARSALEQAFFEPSMKPQRLDYVFGGLIENLDRSGHPVAAELLLRFFTAASDPELEVAIGEIYEYEDSKVFTLLAQDPKHVARIEKLAESDNPQLAVRAQMVLCRMGKLAEDQIDVLNFVDAGNERDKEDAARLAQITPGLEDFRGFFRAALQSDSAPFLALKKALARPRSILLLGLDQVERDEPALPAGSLRPLAKDLARLYQAGLVTHLALPCTAETLKAWNNFVCGGKRPDQGFLIEGQYPPDGEFDPFFEAEIEECLSLLKALPSGIELLAYHPNGTVETQGELWLASKVGAIGTLFERSPAARVVVLGAPAQLSKEPSVVDDVVLPTFSSELIERLSDVQVSHLLERLYSDRWPFEYLEQAGMNLEAVREALEPKLFGLKDFAVSTEISPLTKLPWEYHADPDNLYPHAWDGVIMRHHRDRDDGDDGKVALDPAPELLLPAGFSGR